MQLNSNTLSSENPNLTIIMDPHRSRGTKFSKQLKCEHMVFIVFSIVIIALLGIILQKVDKECEISVPQIGKKSNIYNHTYRVSHIEMVETKWLCGVVELRILMNSGV